LTKAKRQEKPQEFMLFFPDFLRKKGGRKFGGIERNVYVG